MFKVEAVLVTPAIPGILHPVLPALLMAQGAVVVAESCFIAYQMVLLWPFIPLAVGAALAALLRFKRRVAQEVLVNPVILAVLVLLAVLAIREIRALPAEIRRVLDIPSPAATRGMAAPQAQAVTEVTAVAAEAEGISIKAHVRIIVLGVAEVLAPVAMGAVLGGTPAAQAVMLTVAAAVQALAIQAPRDAILRVVQGTPGKAEIAAAAPAETFTTTTGTLVHRPIIGKQVAGVAAVASILFLAVTVLLAFTAQAVAAVAVGIIQLLQTQEILEALQAPQRILALR